MSKITQEYLKKLLKYDKDTGIFTWLDSRHNRVKIGSVAGTRRLMDSGKWYGYIMIDGKHYSSHRLAWLYVYGEFPKDQIDHIDGDSLNNKISNLRLVTHQENQKNRCISKNNTSGVTGVYFRPERNRYVSAICINGKLKTLGYFKERWDAICSRKSAENKYGYHVNHGMAKPLQGV